MDDALLVRGFKRLGDLPCDGQHVVERNGATRDPEDISQAIIAAATEVYGELPVVNGVSAEGAVLRHVWIPCVLTGFANPGANLHAPDENIHLDTCLQGIKYAAAIMEHFGTT